LCPSEITLKRLYRNYQSFMNTTVIGKAVIIYADGISPPLRLRGGRGELMH